MNKIKDQKELNKISFSGFFFVEDDNLWAYRETFSDKWIAIPRDVLEPGKSSGINSDELIGKLFRLGYYVEAKMILDQINESNKRDRCTGRF